MDTLKIAGSNQPDMPWEDRPAGSKEVMWRYTQNPIIGRHALSTSNSIFNSAVVPFKKGKYNYAGVFRCDDTNRRMRIHVGFSVDGLRWEIEESDFRLEGLPDYRGGPEPSAHWRVRTPRSASGSTATILALRRSATNTTLRGATATTGRRSALRGRMTSRRSTSLKTHFFPITATGFCFRARSGAGSRCCRVRATRVTRPSGTSSIRRAPTWSSGAATVM